MDGEIDAADNLDNVEIIYSDDESYSDEMVEEFSDPEENVEINVQDLSKHTFVKHKGSIFMSALREDGQYMITGGEDDTAFVWCMNSKSIYFECTGHKDSVTQVGFNYDGTLVVSADMGGLIQVWNISDQKLLWCTEGEDLEWLFWHPKANVLFSGCHSGDIYIWQVPQSSLKLLASHGPSTSCAKILPDGKRLIAGYSDGQIKLWDIKLATIVWQLDEPLAQGITNLDLNTDGTLLAVAPTSQIILASDGRLISTLQSNKENEKDVEVVLINSELGVLVTGALSGELCVWDLSRQTLRHKATIDCSVTVIKWGNNGKVFVGAVNGCIYVCDVRSGLLEKTLTGHKKDILDITVCNKENFILSSSDDCTVKLFDI